MGNRSKYHTVLPTFAEPKMATAPNIYMLLYQPRVESRHRLNPHLRPSRRKKRWHPKHPNRSAVQNQSDRCSQRSATTMPSLVSIKTTMKTMPPTERGTNVERRGALLQRRSPPTPPPTAAEGGR